MAKFGLVTEGITDQIVIENILCGFYKDYDDLDEEIIECVIKKMVDKIDMNESFYEKYREKIIFAISVHSLECWILPIFLVSKKEKILNCEDKLKTEVPKVSKKLKTEKNYKNYDKLTQDFLKHKKLIKIVSQNSSFQIFIDKLPKEI